MMLAESQNAEKEVSYRSPVPVTYANYAYFTKHATTA